MLSLRSPVRSGAIAALALNVLTVSARVLTRNATCADVWTPTTAADWVAAINPGWNVGNTLDATPDEGSWNNPAVTQEVFDDVAAAGFKSVRIPVTYAYHFTGSSPDWTIDSTWLQRVSDVVDMALASGLYVVTNVHHDSWVWADVTASGANLTMIEEKFYRTWLQIGEKLACKSSRVAFESINEPPANTAADGAELNKLNELFIQALQESGGYNAQRVINLAGGGMDSVKTSEWLEIPAACTDQCAIQYHYYSPYDLIFQAWGKTVWGSEADKAAIEADIANIRGNFTGIPLLIGETEANMQVEPAARRKYYDFLTSTATKYDTSLIVWDNGEGLLDRNTNTARDPQALEIILNGVKGVANSLSDSTTDASATSQSSSAFLFHKVGDEVADQTVNFILNGNTIKSIAAADGTTLEPSSDYTVSGGDVTLKSSFLAQYLSADAAPGSKTNLTVSFSAGATANVDVVQWDVPAFSSTTSKAVSGSDLVIPVTWKGIYNIAAVKMLRADGVYLFDDWTQYLGPLQQARGTYSGQWDRDGASVKITATTVAAVVAAGVDTVFTFEFYPRVPGNSVNYTLTV
ncbi:hypothetical protein TruAng_002681 [Truncatella angustata]|nr:hypothetical protein TruAng_002681 [Truncatella angustata]